MKLPKVGDKVIEEGKTLRVSRVFRNKAGYQVVEYIDRNGLQGCCLPEYWWKKIEEQERLEKERTNKSAGRLGSEAPS